MKLPPSLGRRAIMDIFDRLEPVKWEWLFLREDRNGLVKYRVPGDYPSRAYYLTDGIMEWLVRNGHYTLMDFRTNPRFGDRKTKATRSERPILANI